MLKQIIGGTLLLSAAQLWANTFTLTSNDIANGEMLSTKHVFKGFGCEGENISPHLAWSGAPKETKAFAVFAYDPDAPTGSGWWHWQVTDLPANTSELAAGAGNSSSAKLPEGAVQINNDFGVNGLWWRVSTKRAWYSSLSIYCVCVSKAAWFKRKYQKRGGRVYGKCQYTGKSNN